MRAFIILVLLLFVAPAHAGKYRAIICKGKVGFGTTDSGIDGLTNDCGWLTKSAIGARIFKVCQVGDECEITGVVDENDWLVRVSRVRKVDVIYEPPVDIVRDAACLASPMRALCNDANCWSVKIDVLNVSRVASDKEIALAYRVNVSCDVVHGKLVVYKDVSFRLCRTDGEWKCEM